jgi:peptide/nickel transport system substrate-binding protein
MSRQRAWIGCAIAACVVFAGCSGSGGPADRKQAYASGGTFTIAIPEDRGPYDPYHSASGVGFRLAYDPLIHMRSDGSFVSGLAEKWSADAMSATFTLRDDVTCSDGTPLTASQVAADIRYNANPKNQSQQYGLTVPTQPMRVTADDRSRTVRLMMDEPFGFLLHAISQLPIVCANGLKNREVFKNGSAGTGPYVLIKHNPGQNFTFKVRKDYRWGPAGADTAAPGTPETVVLRVVPNETTAANLLLSGEVNLAGVTGEDQARLDAQGLERLTTSGPGAWLRFNQLEKARPTADKRIRQALLQALDLEQVVKVSTGNKGSASKGLVAMEPNPCPGDTMGGQLPGYNFAQAQALLDQAGWTKDADGQRRRDGKPLSLDLHFVPPMSPFEKPTADLMAEKWKALGIQVQLVPDTLVSYARTMYETSDWDLYVVVASTYLQSHMVKFVSGTTPPDGLNGSGVVNPQYTALAAKAQTLTPPEACTYWKQAEQALWHELSIVPISDRPTIYYLRNAKAEVSGFDRPAPTSMRLLQ